MQAQGTAGTSSRRQAWLLSIACVAAGALCVFIGAGTHGQAAALQSRTLRGDQLTACAQAIARCRGLPQYATDGELPQSSVLAMVADAMQASQLPGETLVSTSPQPPRKLPGSDQVEIAYRLMFENVPLQQLMRCCHALSTQEPALRISSLHLRAGVDRQNWSADVGVSYWQVMPEGARIMADTHAGSLR